MKTHIDITGEKFGRLTVIKYTHSNKDKKACFDCLCDCGNTVNVSGRHLRSGNTKSCGCLNSEKIRNVNFSHGACSGGKTKEYHIWRSMIARCYNNKNKNYNQYGGRGITVSNEWKQSFAEFISDMGNKPSKNHTIDRIDNGKGYSKENCRWVEWCTQQNNKRSNRVFNLSGKKYTAAQLAKEFNIKHIYAKLHRGWDIDKILKSAS